MHKGAKPGDSVRPASLSLGGPHFLQHAAHPSWTASRIPRGSIPGEKVLPSAGSSLVPCFCNVFVSLLSPSAWNYCSHYHSATLPYPFRFSYHSKFKGKKMMVQNHQEQLEPEYQPAQPWKSVSPSLPFRVLWVKIQVSS